LAEVQATLTPKINSINDAAKFTGDLVRNPPSNAWEMLQVANSAFDLSGVVSLGIGAAFPLAAPVLPMLKGIFDLFGGASGPSIGEITLGAIASVSQQISQGFAALENTIQKLTEQQATRSIDTILSGVNDIAKEQSAVNVFKNIFANEILEKLEADKAEVFAEYTETLNAQRAAWVSDIEKALTEARAKTDAQYKLVQSQLAGIAGGVFQQINDKLQKAAADGAELLELQRQIDEINGLINDGSIFALARDLVRGHFGITT
jgi:Skp family chaperone for outer membrane proteins